MSTTSCSQAGVAVAVVSWNTRDLLARCLDALRGEGAEVWVVDNASTDGSAAMVRERFPWVTLIASAENLGFGHAVNTVAEQTRTPWLVAANADTAVQPGALDALLAAGAAHPGAGALAPALVLPDGTLQHSAYAFPSIRFALAFQLGLLRGPLADRWCLEGHWDASRPRAVPWSIGAFLLLRRAAFDAAGRFDPAQFMYAEDLDLGWRLSRAGWSVRHVPQARVHHASAAATAQAWGDARVTRWQTETYRWIARRHGRARARTIAAINLAGEGARVAVLSAAMRAAALGASPKLAELDWRRGRARGWGRVHRAAAREAARASANDG